MKQYPKSVQEVLDDPCVLFFAKDIKRIGDERMKQTKFRLELIEERECYHVDLVGKTSVTLRIYPKNAGTEFIPFAIRKWTMALMELLDCDLIEKYLSKAARQS